VFIGKLPDGNNQSTVCKSGYMTFMALTGKPLMMQQWVEKAARNDKLQHIFYNL
jgi:hypothetical protein